MQTKIPAPIGSPMPNPELPKSTPATMELMSGAPFPSARNVTPATLGDKRSEVAISLSEGQKFVSAQSLSK